MFAVVAAGGHPEESAARGAGGREALPAEKVVLVGVLIKELDLQLLPRMLVDQGLQQERLAMSPASANMVIY